jgi:hypothetical protein
MDDYIQSIVPKRQIAVRKKQMHMVLIRQTYNVMEPLLLPPLGSSWGKRSLVSSWGIKQSSR